ncbi:MAG: alpha/beta hydrolase [bacterium]|nr:alpha/beta hydrolase [bacterium]
MLLAFRIVVALATCSLGALAPAQTCPRPAPPLGGFQHTFDAIVPVAYSDGYQTFATMVRPAGVAPSCGWPLVVFVHPLGGTRAVELGLQLAIAGQGFAVWSYDVRGQGQAVQQNPGHGGAGTTLWGPVERCDLAEQILHVAGSSTYAGIVDATRVAVIGSSQGGAHAWAAAAWSGQPLAVPGRTTSMFPVISCAIASDYVAESIEDWLRGQRLWSSWFVEALAGSYVGLPLDPAFEASARSAFVNQDPGILLSAFAAENRGIDGALGASTVPLLYMHSYHDRINSPLLGLQSLQTMSSHRRAILTTGGHNSPANDHEIEFRNQAFVRWLVRWLWAESNEVELERPYVLAELPLDIATQNDPTHVWSRAHVADPLAPAVTTRRYLHDDGGLKLTPPVGAQPDATLTQTIDPQASLTAQNYLDQPTVRDLTNLLTVCPLDELVYEFVTAIETEIAESAAVRLRIEPHNADWLVAALLTVEPPGSGAQEIMLTSGVAHSGTSSVGVVENHTLVLPPVATRIPAGSTVRLRLRNLWLREAPMARQLEVAPRFHDFAVDIVHSDGVGESWIDLPLRPRAPKIKASSAWFDLTTAPPLTISLDGGRARAGQPYFLTFGASGHSPATPFLGATLPIEMDWLVGIVNAAWLTPELDGFLADLDANGDGSGVVDFSAYAPLPASLVGLRLTFAGFVFDDTTLSSGAATNPLDVVLR